MASPKMSPGEKHKSVTSKLAGELTKFDKKEADRELKDSIQKINDVLKAQPSTVPKVLHLLTSGALLPESRRQDDKFHRTAVRYADISIKFIVGWMTSLGVPGMDPITIAKAQEFDTHVARKLLTYATGVLCTDKLCSKSQSEWHTIMTSRHKELGSRLQHIQEGITKQGEISWQLCGVYRQDTTVPNTIRRIDGSEGSLPGAMAIDQSWVMEANWCSATATLAHPETGLRFKLATLFKSRPSLSSAGGGKDICTPEVAALTAAAAAVDSDHDTTNPEQHKAAKKRRTSLGPLAAPLGEGSVASKAPDAII